MKTCYSSRNMQSKLIPIIVGSPESLLPSSPSVATGHRHTTSRTTAALTPCGGRRTPLHCNDFEMSSSSSPSSMVSPMVSAPPPMQRCLQRQRRREWQPNDSAADVRWSTRGGPWPFLLVMCSLFATCCALEPDFVIPLENVTIAQGRDATFTCVVNNLGGYRVAWIKADAKAILAIHEHVITNNDRLSVTHNDYNTWTLVIKSVKMEDRGQYMCQVNTDPMKMQTAYLEVVIPPDIMYEETSGDMMVPEGSSAKLICKARGYPKPKITWRREDGREILARGGPQGKTKAMNVEGELLWLSKVTRSEMGAYLCIASNGVPPSVSKRMKLQVHFHPLIQVPNQLVGAPVDTDVTLVCNAEASPKAINYWQRENGEMIIPNERYAMTETDNSMYAIQMVLVIRRLQKSDFGGYKCISKNSIGGIEATIRLYEMELTKKKNNRHNHYNNNQDEDGGSKDTSTSIINELGEVESSIGTSSKNKNGRFYKGRTPGIEDTYDDSASQAVSTHRRHQSTINLVALLWPSMLAIVMLRLATASASCRTLLHTS